MQACIDRKVLTNSQDVTIAFKILDVNKDGKISLEDFDNMFNSYGGTKTDIGVWTSLLEEADMNGDGVVSFEEF
jgi:Ca2+-binding EF-hand superfamily protein